MSQAIIKPYSVTEAKPRTNTGLQGKHFKAVKRNGATYTVNTRDQDDEKFYHLWDNLENLKYGKTARCGRSNYGTCTTKTEHGIPGYRNICPIGGVTGTYVQPSPIYLKFNPSKHGINDNTKITQLKLSFKHRCTSADVANRKNPEYEGISPNFSGFNTYPSHKVLTVSFNGVSKQYNKNPPLSLKNSEKVFFEFKFPKGITGKTLKEKPIIIQYGNNFEADAGILYIGELNLTVDYIGKQLFFEAHQDDSTVFTSADSDCATTMNYTLKVGYKEGGKIVSPYNQQSNIKYTAPNGVSAVFEKKSDGVTVIAKVKDTSLIPGKKQIYFTFTSTNERIGFDFTSVLRPKPQITLSPQIEKNVVMNSPVIIAKDGCAKKITAYVDKIGGKQFSFNNLTLDAPNMISSQEISNFYTFLQNLDCGEYTIYFQRGNESSKEMIQKYIKIVPTKYEIEAYYDETKIVKEIKGLKQNKQKNEKITLKYIKSDKELINKPVFSIINPTYGRLQETSNGKMIPTKFRINEEGISWSPNKAGDETEIDIGTYYPGEYTIQIQEKNNCNRNNMDIGIQILPHHEQSFSSIFVRGEDSTAFDYDYLVALEGDTITEPIYPKAISLGASYKDISICVDKTDYIGRIHDSEVITLQITNNSENDIRNLQLELNLLKKDENNQYYVSTDEWVENGGLFSNLKNDFYNYNESLYNTVSILNLSEDTDKIDEENVYLNINQLPSGKTIPIKIPFGSFTEREAYMQILLFEEVMEIGICNDLSRKINQIHVGVFDSILTELNISGDTDILFPNKNCPYECFKTENGIRYSVKNIDSSNVEGQALFVINNDPRLNPYQVKYKNKIGNISNNEIVYENKSSPIISFYNYDKDIPNEKASINIIEGGSKKFNIEEDLEEIFLNISCINEIEGKIQILKYKNAEEENEEDVVFLEKTFSEISNKKENIEKTITTYNISLNDIESLENFIEAKYFVVKIIDTKNSDLVKVMSYSIIKEDDDFTFPLKIVRGTKTENQNCRGIKVNCNVNFGKLYPEENLVAYTDSNSIATFFIKIPNEIGKKFTVNSLVKDGNVCKFTCTDNLVLPDNDYIYYNPGQTAVIKVKAIKTVSYLENKIIFKADIKNSGQTDYVDIYYNICNLPNNEGQLQTTFKTKTDEGEYNLIPNEISETILCGTQTDVTPFISLEKIIIENKHINRLHISLQNKKRFNKDISISISEINNDAISKYKYLSHKINIGNIILNDNKIIWNINYLAKDTFITGYIDFEAQNIGISNIQVNVSDFLSNIDKNRFGIQCECRKR